VEQASSVFIGVTYVKKEEEEKIAMDSDDSSIKNRKQ